MNHAQLIDILGRENLVQKFQLHPATIEQWTMRGIPALRWVRIQKYAKSVGLTITIDDIARGAPFRRAA